MVPACAVLASILLAVAAEGFPGSEGSYMVPLVWALKRDPSYAPYIPYTNTTGPYKYPMRQEAISRWKVPTPHLS